MRNILSSGLMILFLLVGISAVSSSEVKSSSSSFGLEGVWSETLEVLWAFAYSGSYKKEKNVPHNDGAGNIESQNLKNQDGIIEEKSGTFTVLGTGEPKFIFQFIVQDSESRWGIGNASIKLIERNGSIIKTTTTIQSDNNGVGVIIIKDSYNTMDLAKIIVKAKGYEYWEQEISSWELYEARGERIGIPTSNWQIDDYKIINAVRSDYFIKLGNMRENAAATSQWEDLVNVGDYYELNVYMEKIPQ